MKRVKITKLLRTVRRLCSELLRHSDFEILDRLEVDENFLIALDKLRSGKKDRVVIDALRAIAQANWIAEQNTIVPDLIAECERERDALQKAVDAFAAFASLSRAHLCDGSQRDIVPLKIEDTRRSLEGSKRFPSPSL